MTKSGRSVDALRKTESLRYKVPPEVVSTSIKQFFASLETPIALSCWLLYEAGEFEQLVNKDLNPKDYNDSIKFRDDFTAVSFLRKASFLKTGIDTREVALDTFKSAEQQCLRTNIRFSNLSLDPLYKGPNVTLLHAMSCKIAKILGDISAEEFFDGGSFGPGASTSITGRDTSAVRKFREERSITASLYQLVGPFLHDVYPLWYRDGKIAWVEIAEFSKIITVPKNAKTDRTIAIEPGLNVWFQKSIGKSIRRKLRRNGLDLDSDEKNKAGAKLGSLSNKLATVDFSAASDTISDRMLLEVLPSPWYALLDVCRSRRYNLDGVVSNFHKFSSMGNGFTFELESLIFYAAALASAEYVGADLSAVSVFGDDVIIPSEAYATFTEFSDFLGFTVNARKSYSESYFRESCGSYYFSGVDVKPFFFKKGLSSVFTLYNFINGVSDLAHRRNRNIGRDSKFMALHAQLVLSLPPILRLLGERSAGMGCIHANFDECRPKKLRDWLEGYSFKAFSFEAKHLETDSPAILLARLKYPSPQQYGNLYSLRAVTVYRITRYTVLRWYNFGPWV